MGRATYIQLNVHLAPELAERIAEIAQLKAGVSPASPAPDSTSAASLGSYQLERFGHKLWRTVAFDGDLWYSVCATATQIQQEVLHYAQDSSRFSHD